MTKPRDCVGNDLIVPCTATAMEVARVAGLDWDQEFVKKLANGFYSQEMKRLREVDKFNIPVESII